MALPRGLKKDKNGKKVYSQSARAVKYRKEQGTGEFAEGAAAEPLQPALVETPPEPISTPGELSTESIGVVTTVTVPEPVAAPAEEPPRYFCQNCKGTINQGDTECPTCEERLNWSGLR